MIMIIESNSDSLNIYPQNDEQQGVFLEDEIEKAIKEASLTITSCSISLTKSALSILQVLSLRPWQNLESLGLSNNKINAIGCKMISKGNWPRLHTLMLENNNIQSIGISHLVKARMPALTELWLMRNKIGCRGVKEVSKFNTPILNSLYLDSNQMALDEIFHIYLTEFPQIEYCYIYQNHLQANEQLGTLAQLKFRYLQEFYTT